MSSIGGNLSIKTKAYKTVIFTHHTSLPTNQTLLPTKNVCKVLGLQSDTFRYRIRKGYYPDAKKVGGKRRFSEIQLRKIAKMTTDLFGFK